MILGAMALFMISSYNVQASEINSINVSRQTRLASRRPIAPPRKFRPYPVNPPRIVHNGAARPVNSVLDMQHRIKINQSADIDVSLSAYKTVV